jgi:hypothetical protein
MASKEIEMSTWTVNPQAAVTAEFLVCKLANMCDGAASEDGNGFNKNDTDFGHSLASAAAAGRAWTIKQAAAALKIIRKYQRQIGGKEFIDNWLDQPVFRQQPADSTAEKPVPTRRLTSRDTVAVLSFVYDLELVTAVKAIKGEHRGKKFWASWDANTRVWTVPVNETSIVKIMEIAEQWKFEVEQRFTDYLDRVQAKTAESRVMLALNDNRNIILCGDTVIISIDDVEVLKEFSQELGLTI